MKKNIIIAIIAIVAILAVSIGYMSYSEYAKNKSLEEHFGNVELSDEELEQMAEDVVMGDEADDIYSSNQLYDDLDIIKSNLYSTRDTIEQTVDLYTGSLSDKECSGYINMSNDFVSFLKEYLKQNNAFFNKSVDMLFDGDSGDKIRNNANILFQEELNTTDLYGNYLIDTIKESVSDNTISNDEQKNIKNNLQELLNIVDSHRKAEIEAEKEISNE